MIPGPAWGAPGPLPAHLSLRRTGDDLVLERRWLTRGGVVAVVAWQLVTVALVVAVAEGLGGPALRWSLFGALAVGCYFALAVAMNRTRIRAGAGRLAVSHGPFPCPGWGSWGRTFTRAQMAQFSVKADPARSRAELRLRLVSGNEVPLVCFSDAGSALAVEAHLRERISAPGVPASPYREQGVGLLLGAAYLAVVLTLLRYFLTL